MACRSTIYNAFFKIWKKGYLYILIGFLIFVPLIFSAHLGISDWQIHMSFFSYIRDSLLNHSLPFFWWNVADNVACIPTMSVSNYFLANPEPFVFSPFIFLLFFLNSVTFVKALIFIHFVIGTVGLFLLSRQQKWTEFQFRFAVITLLICPVIIQHLAVGYIPWINLFFLSWFFYFLLHKNRICASMGMSALFAIILFQGGAHVFVWLGLTYLLYNLLEFIKKRSWKKILEIFVVFLATFLLAAPRLYLTFIAYGIFQQNIYAGFNLLGFLFWSLVPPLMIFPVDLLFNFKSFGGVPSWDAGIFIGPIFVLWLVLVINFKKLQVYKSNFASLFYVAMFLLLISFYSIYHFFIQSFHFLFNTSFLESAERYPYRFFILAYFCLSLVLINYLIPILDIVDNKCKNWLVRNVKFLRWCFLTVSLAAGAVFIAILAFKNRIFFQISQMISDAYYSNGQDFLSKLMVSKNGRSLDYYVSLFHAKYLQSIEALAILFVISLLCYLLIKYRHNFSAFLKENRYFYYEAIIFLFFCFAGLMWTLVSVFNKAEIYGEQQVKTPIIETAAKVNSVSFSPSAVTIKTAEGGDEAFSYSLKSVKITDAKFLIFSPNSLKIDYSKQYLSFSGKGNEISINVRHDAFLVTFCVSIISWVVLCMTCLMYALFGKKNERLITQEKTTP